MGTVLFQVSVGLTVVPPELSPTQRSKERRVVGTKGAGKDPLTGVG